MNRFDIPSILVYQDYPFCIKIHVSTDIIFWLRIFVLFGYYETNLLSFVNSDYSIYDKITFPFASNSQPNFLKVLFVKSLCEILYPKGLVAIQFYQI
jgi:hypothetical protein